MAKHVGFTTLRCAIKYLHANLSTFHTTFNNFKPLTKHKILYLVVSIQMNKQSYNFLYYDFNPR